jgi:sulfur carrier protein
MQIIINGQRREASAQTVSSLLEELCLAGKRVAVERNGELVPRSSLSSTPVLEGDHFEIVVAVGGG